MLFVSRFFQWSAGTWYHFRENAVFDLPRRLQTKQKKKRINTLQGDPSGRAL